MFKNSRCTKPRKIASFLFLTNQNQIMKYTKEQIVRLNGKLRFNTIVDKEFNIYPSKMNTKICYSCGEETNNFSPNCSTIDGMASNCRRCINLRVNKNNALKKYQKNLKTKKK